ncbi:MAG: hypothetical protein MJ123_02985 [Lachnospiraceae bacterium]|nr:hypothetical protein [Lachnospiraceae bacterium]
MEYFVSAVTVLLLVAFIFIKNSLDDKKRVEKILNQVKNSFGKAPNKKYEDNELNNIKKLFERFSNENSIDDITANDLDLDSVFKRMNYCKSSMGSEYLYYRLRTPICDESLLENCEKKIEGLKNNEEERLSFVKFYLQIGRLKSFSFFETLDYFADIKPRSLLPEVISFVVFIIGIICLFILPPLAAALLIGVLVYNIISYYSLRGSIEENILIFSYMVRFINIAKQMTKINSKVLEDDLAFVKEATEKLEKFSKNSGIVTKNGASGVGIGNPLDMFADYGRMIFHVDLIKFNMMLSQVQENLDTIASLYMKLGEIESYVSLAFYRASLDFYCIPKREDNLSMTDGYHPLIDNPVTNSISAQRSVLITGSNASGKSTFLKTVALNYLFANTIHTCLANEFSAPYMHLFSSMSLRDSIESSDSYFMVEIKAIKRIIDFAKENPDIKILCFVDEVLRGTNTVERIAAGCEILKNFSNSNVLCFAATHDGELTHLLENCYDNYHFNEEIVENDVLFNYMIKSGRATSRNAIKLLNVMGFDDAIVANAEKMAEAFVKTGEWK